jgi:type I restriction enzyme S subunit
MSEFMTALGLETGDVGITRRAFALNWSGIDRWSLEFIRQKTGDLDPASGRYPVTTLGESIADLTNGWSPKCFDRPVQGEEWGVLKLGAVSFGQFNASENKALPPSLKPRPEYEIRPGDVLISRANITRLVGACAHVVATPPRLMLCDKIFRVVLKEHSPILPEYIAEVMKIPHLRRQIESSVTGSSPTMKNITKPALLALRIPLPPPAIQRQIVDRAIQGRQDAASERVAAEKLASETASEIESMILGHMPPPKTKLS